MTLHRSGPISSGIHRADIEEAAQTFRDRIAFATVKAATDHGNITMSSLRDLLPSGPSPRSINLDLPSSMDVSPRVEQEYPVGLGLGFNVGNVKSQNSSEKDDRRNSSIKKSTSREPSLYDAIFGPGYSRLTQKSNLNHQSKSSPSPPLNGSPHVRQGSSAQLEKVVSSPRPPHIPHWHNPASLASNEVWYPDSYNYTGIHQRAESFFAHPLSSPTKSQQQHRRESTGGFASPNPFQQYSSSRNRMKSVGGSVLPNGHPASSLAQDLGIASGSTSRSRQSSSTFPLSSSDHNQCRQQNKSFEDRHDQSETDRLAAGLLRGMSDEQVSSTPPRTTFADPNLIITPRRRRRRSNGEDIDAAAHSLLDLASSPSPNSANQHQHRFPGATPSLDRLVDEIRVKPNRLFDDEIAEICMSSPQCLATFQSGLSTKNIEGLFTPPRPLQTGLGSPPMTPPHSDTRPRKRSAFDLDYNSSSSCPNTPSRLGQLILVPKDDEDSRKAQRVTSPKNMLMKVIETPKTPPMISTPSTPKAPGSNFCYGEFLHVSPSPQPRMRFNSCNGTPLLTSLQNTPTRATKSRARFASMDKDTSLLATDTDLTSEEMILTPGRYQDFQTNPRNSSFTKRVKLHHP